MIDESLRSYVILDFLLFVKTRELSRILIKTTTTKP